MANVSLSKIISTAKSLVGNDNGRGCDIMKWYGGFDTTINEVACCCAGQMYLFEKAGALSMLHGKTANCGVLAEQFYKANAIHKGASDVRVGDLALFSWGKTTTSVNGLRQLGYWCFDHVELIIEVNDKTIITIGANNGGAECDDFQVKTRYKSDLAATCRPAYTSTGISSATTNDTSPDIFYRVRTNGKWLPEVKNLEDFAGLAGSPITDITIRVNKGSVKYRVHSKSNNSWYPWVTGCNINDDDNGYAGNGDEIDAIQVVYYTDKSVNSNYYFADYRVSALNKGYYDWQLDDIVDSKQDGYAGCFGHSIDRLQINLVR